MSGPQEVSTLYVQICDAVSAIERKIPSSQPLAPDSDERASAITFESTNGYVRAFIDMPEAPPSENGLRQTTNLEKAFYSFGTTAGIYCMDICGEKLLVDIPQTPKALDALEKTLVSLERKNEMVNLENSRQLFTNIGHTISDIKTEAFGPLFDNVDLETRPIDAYKLNLDDGSLMVDIDPTREYRPISSEYSALIAKSKLENAGLNSILKYCETFGIPCKEHGDGIRLTLRADADSLEGLSLVKNAIVREQKRAAPALEETGFPKPLIPSWVPATAQLPVPAGN